MARMTLLSVSVVAVGALMAAGAAWGLVREVPDFWDPCHEWGVGRDGSGSYAVQPTDECPGRSTTSETKAEAAFRLAIVHGLTLVAAGLAVAAGFRKDHRIALAAAALTAVEAVVLFLGHSLVVVAAVALAALFLAAAVRWRRVSQPL